MAENSKIEWTDHTFNPWTGCTKVGPGCDGCYAEAWAKRSGAVQWGPHADRRRTTVSNWRKPLIWQKHHGQFEAQHGRRQRVFCASLADVFDNTVPDAWRLDLFRLIRATPNLDWLLLTKRIGNAPIMLANVRLQADEYLDPFPWPNVWIGATVVNQEEFDRDLSKLDKVPAAVRFLSVEPMLGPIVDGDGWLWGTGGKNGIDWVICGGESGPGARQMHPDWARSLRDQCADAGVPFMFKQWGEWAPYDRSAVDSRTMAAPGSLDDPMQRIGKKLAGRLLDGVEHNGFPA